MIIGIGTDILNIQRVERTFLKFGNRFVERLLHVNEKAEFLKLKNNQQKINYLAKHFCAKEAFLKAVGTGLRKPYVFNKIEIKHNDLGKAFFVFHGQQKNIFKNAFLSLSDENNFVLSFVVLEGDYNG